MSSASTVRPIIVIVGPTAGGKTALSIDLARTLPGGGECVNADSMQVYRGMDIGTAKPTPEERCGIDHHLLDVADPNEPFTLDSWHTLAESAIAEIRRRGRWPVVVGGSNLHVQALLFGLFQGPAPDPALRASLQTLDDAALRSRLESVDPEAADRIHRADRRRTIRAIEVAASGTRISDLQTQWSGPPRRDALLVGIDWPVEAINRRINTRVQAMVDAGLIDEVRSLRDTLGLQAREALGYKQLLQIEDQDTAIEQIKIRTRRFAKQQRTWLRRFRAIKPAYWLQGGEFDAQTLAKKALSWIIQQGKASAS